MTLIVLALDALDAGLVEKWDIENLMLERHQEIETFDHSKDQPYTLEVWPTVATGKHPREHGIGGKEHSKWSTTLNPLFNFASNFLSFKTRDRIGDKLNEIGFEQEYNVPERDLDTFMNSNNRVVHNWPGIINRDEIVYMWKLGKEKNYDISELKRLVFGRTAEHFGWAKEMLNYNTELACLHNHSLDILGHTYIASEKEKPDGTEVCDSQSYPEELEFAYNKIGIFVKELHKNLGENDDILILSDHGMRNGVLDDDKFGEHSYRAFASTTIDEELPESVFECRDWIEENVDEVSDKEGKNIDMPREQLRDLGYIE